MEQCLFPLRFEGMGGIEEGRVLEFDADKKPHCYVVIVHSFILNQ